MRLLEPVSQSPALLRWRYPGFHWVVIGGETTRTLTLVLGVVSHSRALCTAAILGTLPRL